MEKNPRQPPPITLPVAGGAFSARPRPFHGPALSPQSIVFLFVLSTPATLQALTASSLLLLFFNIYCVQMSAKQPPLHWRRHPNALSSSSAPRSRSRTVLQPQPCRRPPQPCRPSSPASKSRTSSCASPLVRIRSCSRRRSPSTRSSTGPSSVLVSRQRFKPGPPRGAPGARPLPRLCRLQPDPWLRPDSWTRRALLTWMRA